MYIPTASLPMQLYVNIKYSQNSITHYHLPEICDASGK